MITRTICGSEITITTTSEKVVNNKNGNRQSRGKLGHHKFVLATRQGWAGKLQRFNAASYFTTFKHD